MCSHCGWEREDDTVDNPEREREAIETDEAAGEALWLTYSIAIGSFMGGVAVCLVVMWAILQLYLSQPWPF